MNQNGPHQSMVEAMLVSEPDKQEFGLEDFVMANEPGLELPINEEKLLQYPPVVAKLNSNYKEAMGASEDSPQGSSKERSNPSEQPLSPPIESSQEFAKQAKDSLARERAMKTLQSEPKSMKL